MVDQPEALRIRELGVRYHGGPERAVRDVSLTLPAGAGIIVSGGPGAGKTSLVRALLGLTAYSGEVGLLDGAPSDASVRRRVGFGPQAANFAAGMTPRRTLGLVARLRGLSPTEELTWLARAGLTEDRWDRSVDPDSSASRRLSLALGFMGRPELVVLDDPPYDEMTEALIAGARADGSAVLAAVTDPWPELLDAVDGAEVTLVAGSPA